LTNNVGLRNTVLYDAATYERSLADWSLPEPWLPWQEHMNERLAELRWWVWGTAAALALLALAAAWRGRAAEAVAIGPALVFAGVALTCYYWSMLVVTLVRRSTATATAAGLLALNGVLGLAHFASPAFELRYGVMSWALVPFFVAWLLGGILRRTPSVS
jgi:hypothetical protein